MLGKIRPEPSTYGDWIIAGLGVAPDRRRRGVGRLLVKAALVRAAEASATTVWLKVLSTNTPALRLYRSSGFVEAARYRNRFVSGTDLLDDLRLVVRLT